MRLLSALLQGDPLSPPTRQPPRLHPAARLPPRHRQPPPTHTLAAALRPRSAPGRDPHHVQPEVHRRALPRTGRLQHARDAAGDPWPESSLLAAHLLCTHAVLTVHLADLHRQIFDKLAHSSIMRLNESSMDKARRPRPNNRRPAVPSTPAHPPRWLPHLGGNNSPPHPFSTESPHAAPRLTPHLATPHPATPRRSSLT